MQHSRRSLLKSAALGTLAAATRAIVAQTVASGLANDPMRPCFHLLPAKNWMNDPNGPIYFRGKYHMFFQYNPKAAVWGNMSWYHAVSPDMLHWTPLPLAFTPTPGGPDAAGCFSGSTIAMQEHGRKRVYAVYTGVVRDPAQETIRNEGLKETQCLAWSDDPMLREWSKLPEPVIAAPPPHLQVTGFRDPSAWRDGDWYYMTVGSGVEGGGGCVLLYRSRDLHSWEYLHELASGTWDGAYTSNPVTDGEMWECPEFFPLDGGHVLIYSTEGKVFWQSGEYDKSTMRFRGKKAGLLDFDAFYAPKTQLDAQGRRILWGWVPERRAEEAMRTAGWSGLMSLPRWLRLDADGTLRMDALPELTLLRGDSIAVANSRARIPAATGEFVCSGDRADAFTLHLKLPAGDLLTASYDPLRHTITADGHTLHLLPQDTPQIHGFVDGSVLEVFIASRAARTKRFYYGSQTAPDVECSVTGADVKLEAWAILPISRNRLTDVPA